MKHINFLLDSDTVEIIDIDAKNNQRSRTSQIIYIIKQFYQKVSEVHTNEK